MFESFVFAPIVSASLTDARFLRDVFPWVGYSLPPLPPYAPALRRYRHLRRRCWCLLPDSGHLGKYDLSVLDCSLLVVSRNCTAITPTYNPFWLNETAKYAVAIKADPISHPEVRGNLADTPQYDYWEKRKGNK